jgi:hypothetical protein
MLLGNKIGLMKTPVDGNPFKFMAVLGHSSNVSSTSTWYVSLIYVLRINREIKASTILTFADPGSCYRL